MTVEQELRDTLADRAGHALPADELADTVVRRVRRGRQRVSVAGAALVAGVALVGGTVMGGTGGVQPAATSASAATASLATLKWWPRPSGPVPNTAMPELVGRWTPVSLTGVDLGAADHRTDKNVGPIEFGADGTGKTSNDCNSPQIAYWVDSGGEFTVAYYTDSLTNCLSGRNHRVVEQAVRIEIRGELLTFYDVAGAELGRYVRSAG